ncbi:shikimate 5-dehydrogenase [Hyphomicrobium denitrificans 1NES1]|uniref:Shikimate dehydrogenase (NADP(+)) n=1 Tax=Hyphomicrobium denitrificans 1NES1 TaxID=670307 RepID=N0B9A3_9HYPH|nr:shikimate dehydrogenase [Hyphomicrobium denitrificans]AGK59608.1 shikimate 5-dehydrogenase [Hyphomicrobium denitrificans 1NES1]
MMRACVIGWPISHSRSPLIHNYWLRQYGIEGTYTREPVKPEDLDAFLHSLEARGLQGCNATVPHKEAAFMLAAIRDPSAVAVSAANTLWLDNGRLACANTDTYGFMANLDASAPDWRKRSGPILILGAGGSARAVVYGFLDAGMSDIRVFNRTPDRAHELARHFGARVTAQAWDARNEHVSEAAVIVNTTTLGMNDTGSTGIDFTRAQTGAVAADLVYVPLETEFLKMARANGLIGVDGLGMLLHQAVPGFEKWFGVRPVVTSELYQIVARDIGGAKC